jgi:hypothetical protein
MFQEYNSVVNIAKLKRITGLPKTWGREKDREKVREIVRKRERDRKREIAEIKIPGVGRQEQGTGSRTSSTL